VITIIGILIALLLPAVQALGKHRGRISAKHLKQLAWVAWVTKVPPAGFPANGWGFLWTGDADRGNDWRQPGCWLYNILPYIEQQPLHDLGLGMPPWNSTDKKAAHSQRMAAALDVFYCPTRRRRRCFHLTRTGGRCEIQTYRRPWDITTMSPWRDEILGCMVG